MKENMFGFKVKVKPFNWEEKRPLSPKGYIEFNSPGPFDSGAFVYSAKHLLEGARMYVDERPSARPGTLIANIIGVKLFGFNDNGPKIVQMA